VAQHALEVALAAKDDFRIAEAYECLGKIAFTLDRFEEACQHFEEARRRFKDLPGGADRHRAGECSMQLAQTLMYMGRSDSQIRPLVLEAQADLSHHEADKLHVARGLLGLGDCLWYSLEEFADSEDTLSAAKAIFEELNCPASTAECLYLIARIYGYRKEYTKALSLTKEALAKAEQTGDPDIICRLLLVMAMYLIHLSHHDEVFHIIERALANNRALGSPAGIAQSLEILGYNCAAKMDLPAARDAYEGARVHFVKMVSAEMGKDGEARCSYNLRKLEGMKDISRAYLSQLKIFVPMY
jgi:tetratricopeptide (TPR) repeat protein